MQSDSSINYLSSEQALHLFQFTNLRIYAINKNIELNEQATIPFCITDGNFSVDDIRHFISNNYQFYID